jgi:FKBP-type peptidyl-prolyl cis-trans isomerase
MKSNLIHSLVLGLLASAVCAADKPDLNDPKQRASYSIGASIGGNLKRQELDVDAQALTAGLTDALAGKLALSDEQMRQTLSEFQTGLKSKLEAKQKVAAEKNLKEGEEFLAANGQKEGVKSTASGLQYKVIKAGAGKAPKATDTVKVHYHGTLIDGTVFDSSVERGEPVTFALHEVIPGWTEGLQLMKEGDKWQLFIPAKLGYGERSPGGKIGPNCALVFDVELLSIEQAH